MGLKNQYPESWTAKNVKQNSRSARCTKTEILKYQVERHTIEEK